MPLTTYTYNGRRIRTRTPWHVVDRAVQLFERGYLVKQVAEVVDVAPLTVTRWIGKLGMTRSASETAMLREGHEHNTRMDRAIAFYQRGASLKRAAASTGAKVSTLHLRLTRLGLIRSRSEGNLSSTRSKRVQQRILQAARMRADGYSTRRIADGLGVSTTMVRNYLRDPRNPYNPECDA